MKTAMRLLEYEKELGTKEVYSIVAVACHFNQCFRECSQAFVKLERLEGLTEKERQKYEDLATALFSRNPPIDRRTASLKCPKRNCEAKISEFDTSCRECGSHFSPCIASGQSILAKQYYTCKTCKHKALESELHLLHLKHCTLCHGKIEGMDEEMPRTQAPAENQQRQRKRQ
jgi:WD repeat-containing protein 35